MKKELLNFFSNVSGVDKKMSGVSMNQVGQNILNNSAATLMSKTPAGAPVQLVNGVSTVLTSITDYLKIAEQEKTKRTEIVAKRDVAIAAIQAQREMISELMQYTFQERAMVLQKQFDVLDHAIANGNVDMVNSSLSAMVSVIQSSPFKNVQDMQQALGNKDFVVRLE
jgi:hypothetical protein